MVDPLQGGWVNPRNHLGRVRQTPDPVAGVDAFGAVSHEEIVARDQARSLFENRHHEFFRRAWVCGRLQNHEGTRADVPGQRARSGLDEGKIGATLGQGLGTVTMATSKPAHERLSGSVVPARLRCGLQVLAGDVVDERFGGVELLFAARRCRSRQRHSRRPRFASPMGGRRTLARRLPLGCDRAAEVSQACVHRRTTPASGGTPMGGFPAPILWAGVRSIGWDRFSTCWNKNMVMSVQQRTKLEAA